MNAADLQTLRTELDAGHPVTGAYNVDDATAAAEVNLANITRIKASMTGSEMFVNTDATDYSGLSDAKKSEWLSFCGIDTHAPVTNGSPAAEFVTYIFGGGSTTVTNLVAARDETVSQGTVIGVGTVNTDDVIKARAL